MSSDSRSESLAAGAHAELPGIRLAEWVLRTRAEGPGWRSAFWFQGCPLRCSGCCNPEMFDADGGTTVPLEQVREELIEALKAPDGPRIEGITLLGGEPLAQPLAAVELARTARRLGLSVMIFTGWTLAELQQGTVPGLDVNGLLQHTDLLVDGRFERFRPEPQRRWIGSANQRVHFLSNRYSSSDADWSRPNTLELRWKDGRLQINGFPVKDFTIG